MFNSVWEYFRALLPWILFCLFDLVGARLNFPVLRDFTDLELALFIFLILMLGSFSAFHRVRSQRETARRALDRRDAIAQALATLAHLRDDGVALRHQGKRVRTKPQKKDWTIKIYKWRDDVSWELAALSPTEVALFHTLDSFDAPEFRNVRDKIVRHEMQMLFAETHRIRGTSLRWQTFLGQSTAPTTFSADLE